MNKFEDDKTKNQNIKHYWFLTSFGIKSMPNMVRKINILLFLEVFTRLIQRHMNKI